MQILTSHVRISVCVRPNCTVMISTIILLAACVAGRELPFSDYFLRPEEFFQDYVHGNIPIHFRKSYRNVPALQTWDWMHFYYHPGSALHFEQVTQDDSKSLRQILHYRGSITRLNYTLPYFLRPELYLPFVFECETAWSRLLEPMWLFDMYADNITAHTSPHHQLICQITGNRMAVLSATEQKQGAPLSLRAPLRASDCLYIPKNWWRRYRTEEGTVAVVFEWKDHITFDGGAKCNVRANFNHTLDKIKFVDQPRGLRRDYEKMWQLRHFVSFLPRTGRSTSTHGIARQTFVDRIRKENQAVQRKAWNDDCHRLADEIFDSLNFDGDTHFSWADLELMSEKQLQRTFEFVEERWEKILRRLVQASKDEL